MGSRSWHPTFGWGLISPDGLTFADTRGTLHEVKFDASQERDDHGRWTHTGADQGDWTQGQHGGGSFKTPHATVDVVNPGRGTGERVFIGGSRKFEDLARVTRTVAALPASTLVLTSATHGASAAVRAAALERGLELHVWNPVFDQPTREAAFFARDKELVDAADRVVSFYDGSSIGTNHEVGYAKLIGKPVDQVIQGATKSVGVKYSPDQPRDFHGRFGGSGALSEQAVAALTAWQGNQYEQINEAARAGLVDPTVSDPAIRWAAGQIAAIDSAMAPLSEDKTVYRAIGVGGLEQLLGQQVGRVSFGDPGHMEESQFHAALEGLKGTIIEDKGFVATTTDREVAGTKVYHGDVIVEMRVPAGVKAVDMNATTHADDFGFEKETLLARGQQFRIDGVSSDRVDTYGTEFPVYVLHMSVIK